ncbi:MAG: tetraacyldisaccharide 4'-kinase [Acidobacteria bacterium]|nr:tetraacyldisaccharide 4'-kinase [Acidobacteriota bacterium]
MLMYFPMYRIPRALVPLAAIVGPVYEAVVRSRNVLYDSSVFRRSRLRSPVISIGNVTTGGTGKTPLAIFTAKKIAGMGFTPAILSRGFGRSDPGAARIIPPGEPIRFPASCLGDEPALVRRHVPQAWLGLSRDRYAAGSRIERQTGNLVFILDDGFQHRKVHRDLDIVVIDPSQPLENNSIFPRGTLREPLSGLLRSHAIVLNRTRESGSPAGPEKAVFEQLHLAGKVLCCEQYIDKMIPFGIWREPDKPAPSLPVPESVFLAAALGNPERFRTDVLKLGVRVRGSLFFRDHYKLQPEDWARCVDGARRSAADAILVTEKDAVKISPPPDFPLLVAVQTTRFRDDEAFLALLRRCLSNLER